MVKGLVSTIIPVYNRHVLLRRAVESVLQQTYRPIEIIIIDDGSNDGTEKVVDEIHREHPDKIYVIHQENAGPGVARENGRKAAKGEFIQYLDSDDILLPQKFELQVGGLIANPDCGISYGKLRHHQLPPDVPWKQTGEKIEFMFPAFLKQRCWSTPAPLYKREVTDAAGTWTNLRQEEDWEYDCRIAAYGIRLHHCDQFIAEIGTDGKMSLCSKWVVAPDYMKDRVKAHELILQHAYKAGITEDIIEMQHFSRELFLLARQCGAAGLVNESRELFYLAKLASGSNRGSGRDFRLYAFLSSIFGWKRAGMIACFIDRFR